MSLVAVVALVILAGRRDSEQPEETSSDSSKVGSGREEQPERFPLPKITPSRFLNTTAEAHYVGNAACIECHRDESESYRKTAHSRAMDDVIVANEPPDGEVHDKVSGRSYRIYRKGGQLRHREFFTTSDGKEQVLADFPMRYVIGSGNNARGYLLESDGFLMESPVTWFASQKAWKLSPGYENDPLQDGFARPVLTGCVSCHSGRLKPRGEATHGMRVVEKSISCERCHGPGSLHVRHRRAGNATDGDIDRTIVNLRHLSPQQQEDVCAQCHAFNAADVDVRGRSSSEFRPGMKMSDFVIGLRYERADESMKVVGHIEQMRLSRCYTESKRLSCTSCHDPHFQPKAENREAYFRSKCINCHQPENCEMPLGERTKIQKRDNCVACHMPRSETEIKHVALTHHRVAVHKTKRTEQPTMPHGREPRTFVPVGDHSQLSQADRLRALGLAYFEHLEVAESEEESSANRAEYAKRARELLERVQRSGMRDPVVDAALAELYWSNDPQRCIQYAKRALSHDSMPAEVRRDALFLLATSYFGARQFALAQPLLERLVKIERSERYWLPLSVCRRQNGDLPGALRAGRTAAAIRPDRVDIHLYLAALYKHLNEPVLARKHEVLADELKRIVQRE